MEAELIKENIITTCPSSSLKLNITAEGEAIVPDTKNDIAKILFTEGKCFIEKTEIQNGRVIFTGTAEFTVLYTPESGESVNSITSKIPFNHIEECESIKNEDRYKVLYDTLSTECTLLNSRKISLKSIIRADFISYSDLTLPLVTGISNHSIERKLRKTAFSHISSCFEECFTVSDILEIPNTEPPVDIPLLCRTEISDFSVKTVTGKAVIKGTLSVFRLYSSSDGTVSHMKHDLPFTEIIDVPNLSEDAFFDLDIYIKNHSVSEDPASPERYAFSADICVFITVFMTENVHVIEDAYLPGTALKIEHSEAKKFLIKDKTSTDITVKETIELPSELPSVGQLYPVYAKIIAVDTLESNDSHTVKGIISANLIYLSSEDSSVFSHACEIPFSAEFEKTPEVLYTDIKAKITHCDYNLINSSKLDLRFIINITAVSSEISYPYFYISAVNIGESIDKTRPSIIVYFVKSGDTLWNIAKKYHTTVEKILSANSMDKDEILNSGMRLLIPA